MLAQQSNLILNPTTSHPTDCETSSDVDKRNIYKVLDCEEKLHACDLCIAMLFFHRHPLFPLMALLLEKCELASHTPDSASADGFDVDIQAFVQQQDQANKPFLNGDAELDNLMLKAIQVLRIHLLELEKVTDLCQDFCNRYISCLRGKLQSDTLLRVDNMFDDEDLLGCDSGLPQQTSARPPPLAQNQSQGQGQLVSGGTVYQMVQTPQGIVAQPIQIQTMAQQQSSAGGVQPGIQPGIQPSPPVAGAAPTVVHGSTPLSQIGLRTSPFNQNNEVPSHSGFASTPHQSHDTDDADQNGAQAAKRGVLPKQATAVMKSWLFQHIIHPYPTEDEKRQIAHQTNLSLLQVNNWFINARRRILQPMLDASDPSQAKSKKKTTPNRPMQQRFWPETIANIQPQPVDALLGDEENTAESTVGASAEGDDASSSSDRPSSALHVYDHDIVTIHQ